MCGRGTAPRPGRRAGRAPPAWFRVRRVSPFGRGLVRGAAGGRVFGGPGRREWGDNSRSRSDVISLARVALKPRQHRHRVITRHPLLLAHASLPALHEIVHPRQLGLLPGGGAIFRGRFVIAGREWRSFRGYEGAAEQDKARDSGDSAGHRGGSNEGRIKVAGNLCWIIVLASGNATEKTGGTEGLQSRRGPARDRRARPPRPPPAPPVPRPGARPRLPRLVPGSGAEGLSPPRRRCP
jgi:hypothetical protein